jgi:glycosyltransferase involved in cell wall biosynthesis
VLITESAKKQYDAIKKNKNVLIYNPVEDKLFESAPTYDAESKKIISVGRLCYAKNYDLLIKIADRVLGNHPDWSWDIYGDGEEFSRLKSLIEGTSVADRLTLKGNVLNIYDLYSEYSFLVMTSRYEGFPMVLLEGAAKSLPLVSFDIETGPNEIISDGVNGCLISAGDEDAMVERIEDLIQDPEKRKKMSENAYCTPQNFSVERICKEWKSLLKDMKA